MLKNEKKNAILLELAAATKCSAFVLHNLNLDDSNADALVEILQRNKGLGLLSVERNNLKEAGLLKLAKAAKNHPTLRELRVGEQKASIATSAIIALIEVLEAKPDMQKIGVGSIRDDLLLKRMEAAVMHNKDLLRQKRIAAGGVVEPEPPWVELWEARTNQGKAALVNAGGKANAPRRKSVEQGQAGTGLQAIAVEINTKVEGISRTVRAIDWLEEARRIANSEEPQYGQEKFPDEQAPSAASSVRSTSSSSSGESLSGMVRSYNMTGDGSWQRAKEEERKAVIAAFATNTTIEYACFAASSINEDLGVLWGEVLLRNRSLTTLSLESNMLQTESIEKIATAVSGTPALKELRLANQHKNFAQAVEAKLADAIEANHRITKLTVDLRATNARDRIQKALNRNQQEAREAKRAGGEVPFGDALASGPVPGVETGFKAAAAGGGGGGGGDGGGGGGGEIDHAAALNKAKGPQKKRAKGKRPAGAASSEKAAEAAEAERVAEEAAAAKAAEVEAAAKEVAEAKAAAAEARAKAKVAEAEAARAAAAAAKARTEEKAAVSAPSAEEHHHHKHRHRKHRHHGEGGEEKALAPASEEGGMFKKPMLRATGVATTASTASEGNEGGGRRVQEADASRDGSYRIWTWQAFGEHVVSGGTGGEGKGGGAGEGAAQITRVVLEEGGGGGGQGGGDEGEGGGGEAELDQAAELEDCYGRAGQEAGASGQAGKGGGWWAIWEPEESALARQEG